MLRTVTVTGTNYDEAQNVLSDGYDNRRVILREHLFKAPCVEENDGRGLRNLIEHAHEQRLAFQAMGFDLNEMAEIFMVYITVEKLDRESLKQWELANPVKKNQQYDQLYLQSRCQALEAAFVMRDHNAFNHDGRKGLSDPSNVHIKSLNKGKSQSLSINQTFATAETKPTKSSTVQLSRVWVLIRTSALDLQRNLTGLVPSAPFSMVEPTTGMKLADTNFNEPSVTTTTRVVILDRVHSNCFRKSVETSILVFNFFIKSFSRISPRFRF